MSDTTLTKDFILETIKKSHDHLSSFGIRTIGLFGSYVRNEATPESDIDILVEFDTQKRTYDNFFDTCVFLEELLHHKVELVTQDSLSPYIKPYIMKGIEYVPLTT